MINKIFNNRKIKIGNIDILLYKKLSEYNLDSNIVKYKIYTIHIRLKSKEWKNYYIELSNRKPI